MEKEANLVYSFLMTAVTNYHKPSGLHNTDLLLTDLEIHQQHPLFAHWPELPHVITLSGEMKVFGSEMSQQPVAVTTHKRISLVEIGSF